MKLGKLKKLLKKTLVAATLLVAGGLPTALAATAEFTDEQLAYMPASEQVEHFKKGDVTPSDVLEAQIARVNKYNGPMNSERKNLENWLTFNGQVNAICFDRFAEARQQAKAAEERYKNGTARPLEGITIGVKNEHTVIGWTVDMGSRIIRDMVSPAEVDAPIVKSMKEAGGILVFSTTVPECYLHTQTWSKLYGVTRNPWNEYYGVGGSSGGSGAALAAGFCTLATGSDMGGSIRIPAAMCGLYGFKPPFGRVPTSAIQFESLGPLARTFEDMVMLQNVLTGASPTYLYSLRQTLNYPSTYEGLKGKKVAVDYCRKWNPKYEDKYTIEAMDKTVEALKAAGAEICVVDLDLQYGDEGEKIYDRGLVSGEMYILNLLLEGKDKNQMCSYTTKFLQASDKINPLDALKVAQVRDEIHAEVQKQVFEAGCIALVMPTVTTSYVPAEYLATKDKLLAVNGKEVPTEGGLIAYVLTPVWNVLGSYPVVNVPVSHNDRNVPLGVQVVGNTYDDLAAFQVAAALSKELPQNYTGNAFPDFRNEK